MNFTVIVARYAITGVPLAQARLASDLAARGHEVHLIIGFVAEGLPPGQLLQELRRFWMKMRSEARIDDVRIHDLRHTFASLPVSGGASLEMIARLLGHSQMSTTQRYAHLMDTPLREGVNAVADILSARPKLVSLP